MKYFWKILKNINSQFETRNEQQNNAGQKKSVSKRILVFFFQFFCFSFYEL